jgi:hypothetical protein
MRAAPSPNFLGESASAFGRRFVNDSPTRVVLTPPVGKRRFHILRERLRARIELASSPAYTGVGHSQPKPRIARLAKPA